MNIKEIMDPDPSFLAKSATTLVEIARTMREHKVDSVPVVENDKLVGTVTERDLVVRGVAAGKDVNSSTARDVMIDEVFWCYDDADATDVAEYMKGKHLERISVVNHEQRVVGTISLGEIYSDHHPESYA